MPLKKGKKNIGKNIEMMMHEGRPQKQAIAIAMSEAGMSKEKKMPMKKNMYTATDKHTKRRS